jgi:ADP-heptose:LPS heptosyltransferase
MAKTLKRNVLVFHSGALGDFVLTWPLVLALARLYPQSRVVCVTHAQKGALAENVLRVDWSDADIGGWHALHGDPDLLPDRSRKLLADAHSIFSFVSGEEQEWAANVRTLNAQAMAVQLRQRPPDDFHGHVVAHLLDQLRPHHAVATAVEQIVRSVSQRGLMPHRRPEKDLVVVHPGSGSREKCWPLDRFVELIGRIRATARRVRAVVGEVELERWPAADLDRLGAVATELRKPGTYVDLLNSLADASLLVANDSGPGHLGAVIGVPTVSIFGSTDPARWRPLGPRVEVVRGAALEFLSVDEVFGRISAAHLV